MVKFTYILFFFCSVLLGQTNYYATTTGSAANNGLSEGNAWTLAYGVANTPIGSVLNVKAGNYGNLSLTIGRDITVRGYTTNINDVVTTNASTFNENQSQNSAVLPYITGDDTGNAFTITANGASLENFLIHNKRIGVLVTATGDNVSLRNVDVRKNGTGNDGANDNSFAGDTYDGFGFHLGGDNMLVENCLVVDTNAEAYVTKGGNYGVIRNCRSISNANSNPMDYHFLISNNGTGWLVEDCYAYSAPDGYHKGHGFMGKDLATFNTFRRCTAEDTQFEVNFSGVTDNLFENCTLTSTNSSNFGARIFVANGAQRNTFRNFYVHNANAVIWLGDYNDGFVGPGGDRDLVRVGDDNVFENFVVRNAVNLISWSFSGGGSDTAVADQFRLSNWTVANCTNFNTSLFPKTNWIIENVGIAAGNYNQGGGFSGTTSRNNSHNSGSGFPAGWSNLGSPNFVNAAGTVATAFKVQSGSPWINAGTNLGTALDYEGSAAVGTRDIGAFEFGGGAAPTPTCSDGIQNGTETGVDCGGSCAACPVGNSPPTAINFVDSPTDNRIIRFNENTVNPTATMETIDVDGGDTFTYAVIPRAGNDDSPLFTIVSGNQLRLNLTPDFENPVDFNANNIYACNVRVTDSAGNIFVSDMVMYIDDLDDGESPQEVINSNIEKRKKIKNSLIGF